MFSNENALMDSRKDLRRMLRARRKALTRSQQLAAAYQLTKRLRSHPLFLRSQHIAFYLADDGEPDLHLLMAAAEHMGKQCYLPVLHPFRGGELGFSAYRQGDILVKNRLGLGEPSVEKKHFPLWALDLVLMPLVGFDRRGNRLGMGGGFYDRAFAFKKNNIRHPKKPTLMGIAHHSQEINLLKNESWDVAVDYIATDKEIILI